MNKKKHFKVITISLLLALLLCTTIQPEYTYASDIQRYKALKVAISRLGGYGTHCDVFVRQVYQRAHIKGASLITGGCRAERYKLRKFRVKKPKMGDIIIFHYGHAAIYFKKNIMLMSTGNGGRIVAKNIHSRPFRYCARSYYRLIR